MPWEDVSEFHGHYALGTRATLIICDGRELPLGEGIRCPGQLYKEVERHVFPLQLRRTLAVLDTGKKVWFGPLGVSRTGLTYKGKGIAWHEVDRIDLASPNAAGGVAGVVGAMTTVHVRLLIGKRGETAPWFPDKRHWCDELFPTIPNRAVLLKLLQTLRPEHVPMTASKVLGVFMPSLV